jgi:hypothetical protein
MIVRMMYISCTVACFRRTDLVSWGGIEVVNEPALTFRILQFRQPYLDLLRVLVPVEDMLRCEACCEAGRFKLEAI